MTAQYYPELIIECANSHSGNKATLEEIVRAGARFNYPNKSIKFQIFSPDGLALKDFSWYKTYEEITFDKAFWQELIATAHQDIGKVWLDLFDVYSIDVLRSNQHLIHGVKIQASVLENYEIREALRQMDLSSLNVILNISGYELDEVVRLAAEFQAFHFREIILQVGFQSYPTEVKDTALQKIAVIKSLFSNRVCMADHVDANTPAALDIPVLALAHGCDLLEKHICLDRAQTKYDYYSSLEPQQFEMLFKKIGVWLEASKGYFISAAEKNYLEKSIQIPVTRNNLQSGQLLGLADIKFRRTDQTGLTFNQIRHIQTQKKVLKHDKKLDSAICEDDFRQAKIGVIVGGRLKSTRLERKAVLPIDGQPSVEMCLENCLNIPSQDVVILATSVLNEDAELKNYTLGGRVSFFQGDPDDVISRYVAASEQFGIDVIVRVTADCPLTSPEIAEALLKSHFESGADYTTANHFAVGTNCQIINATALKRVLAYFNRAELSEYMTWYFENNPEFFKLNYVDLPENLIRNYRLTLDYADDLNMFEALCGKLKAEGLERTTANVFKVLDENQDIAALNSGIQLKYKTDETLIQQLNARTRMALA
ncbi:cytidylyltransferase domain-containing protein [Legionella sp. CNM-4043-24]|uniref:cytidylyltransferase domain-containing protein n=1 Tax=Legionella sp. CNM-4043-24 TaxID=3421646 RepID=UPI00403AC0DA